MMISRARLTADRADSDDSAERRPWAWARGGFRWLPAAFFAGFLTLLIIPRLST
jgi:hypothetical protein